MPSKKTRAILVGCGGISGAWTGSNNVKKRVDIVGFVDINKKAAVARAADSGSASAIAGTDLQTMIKATSPDVVFDCTVPEAHCEVTLTALKNGCHVLGEKPMADSMANARKMRAAAKKAGKIYSVIQNRRYTPEIRSLCKFINSGAIGDITTVQSNFFIGAHFGGFRDKMKHALLLDMSIHTFDAARLISGADPRSVYCHEWNPPKSWYAHGASAVAIFQMTNNVVYTYEGSWCSEGCSTTWEADWRIIGTKGSILWNGADNFTVEVLKKQDGFVSSMKPRSFPVKCPAKLNGGHDGVIGAFLDAINDGSDPETVCTDNIKSLSMVHGAIASAKAHKRITIRN